VIGLAPIFPVTLVGPVLVIPAYDRIANPSFKPRLTGARTATFDVESTEKADSLNVAAFESDPFRSCGPDGAFNSHAAKRNTANETDIETTARMASWVSESVRIIVFFINPPKY
jgi:hypothetical protein